MVHPTGFRHKIRSFVVNRWRYVKRVARNYTASAKTFGNDLIVTVVQWMPHHWRRHRYTWYLTRWLVSEESIHQFPGRCIYCGSTKRLSNEHALPEGFGGMRILYKGSCECCRLKIFPVEKECLGEMHAIRYRRGLGSRRLEWRRDTLTMWALRNWDGKEEVLPPGQNPIQKWEKVEVPYEEHLTSLGLPVFNLPVMWRGLTVDQCGEAESFIRPWSYEKLPNIEPSTPIYTEINLDHLLLIRMISKIAHCYAVLSIGVDSFEPYLTDLILGNDVSKAFFLVGGDPNHLPRMKTNFQAEVAQVSGGSLPAGTIVVAVRLFADLGAPAYYAVVGKQLNNQLRG
jgi:hypothetical protein